MVVLALVSWCLPDALDSSGLAYGRAGLSIAYLISAVAVMMLYDTIYSNQLAFYLTLGPGAAVFGAVLRAFVAWDGKRFTWQAIGLAVLEQVGVGRELIAPSIHAEASPKGEMHIRWVTVVQAKQPFRPIPPVGRPREEGHLAVASGCSAAPQAGQCFHGAAHR